MEPVWEPTADECASAALTQFARQAAVTHGYCGPATDYHQLYEWSVTDPASFWLALWDHFGLAPAHSSPPEQVMPADGQQVLSGAGWFAGHHINYVDQVYRHVARFGDRAAVIARTESGERAELSWTCLLAQTQGLASWFSAQGLRPGDRVAGYLPNVTEAVVAFLACAHLGLIWSGCGQDYAPSAAASRIAQLAPKVLVCADGYHYGGRWFDRTKASQELAAALPSVHVVLRVPRAPSSELSDETGDWPVRFADWSAAVAAGCAQVTAAGPPPVVRVGFDHPLWVLFSSGTTGTPKGIVHGHGGIVLEHLKAVGLHLGLRPGEVFFWYTSPSWMMWNFLVGGLLVGATILCYDGAAIHPDADYLWQVVAEEKVAVFGTSPGQILASRKARLRPASEHDLAGLRIVGSTGSPLPAESFHWIVAETSAAPSSISGGTDICSAFVGGTPTVAVYPGELSVRYLGVGLEAWQQQDQSVINEVGELVITQSMPSMPIGLWDDADGQRYRSAYFEVYPGIWRHGDWVSVTDRGSVIIHGRSDATLNRHGVRMGSAEIYAAVESLDQVSEAFILGVDGPGGDYWMPLFITLAPGHEFTAELSKIIIRRLRTELSPRHVPDEILLAPGIPHTRTGKKLEVPITAILAGQRSVDVDPQAVDQPELLDWYRQVGLAHRWPTAPAES